ncbi:MAG: hypothetical protein J0I20_33985 [Chloroflexi bacterium]|nr:hypothetical protein [Chloroflexota bacterium]OJW05594.1 MAG: hypothetical protein BGO39_02975 [Chloroflexi bacterium 54-19]
MTQETPSANKPLIGNLFIRNGKSYFRFAKGVEVRIKPVSPALVQEVQRANPRPAPPLRQIAVGDGTFMEEENESDPDYREKFKAWSMKSEDDFADLLLELGVELVTPIDQQAVDAIKIFMLKRFAVDLTQKGDGSDRYIYVRYVLPESEAELQALTQALMGRSKPDEGAIAQAIENFSGNIQG